MRYAVEYGDRLIMMHEGKAILDKAGAEKAHVDTDEIMTIFNRISVSLKVGDKLDQKNPIW